MPDYLGTDSAIELQKRIYQRKYLIDEDKNIVNVSSRTGHLAHQT